MRDFTPNMHTLSGEIIGMSREAHMNTFEKPHFIRRTSEKKLINWHCSSDNLYRVWSSSIIMPWNKRSRPMSTFPHHLLSLLYTSQSASPLPLSFLRFFTFLLLTATRKVNLLVEWPCGTKEKVDVVHKYSGFLTVKGKVDSWQGAEKSSGWWELWW